MSTSHSTNDGDVVVTKNEAGQIVCVTRQDSEGNILKVIAENSAPVSQVDVLTMEIDLIRAVLEGYPESIARLDALRAARVIRSALTARQPVWEPVGAPLYAAKSVKSHD